MHQCTNSKAVQRRSGFTLIEVTLGLAVSGVVLSGILAIASGTLQLNSEISQIQDQETKRNAFITLCRRSFSRLSSRSELSLQVRETGSHYLPSLIYDGAPFALRMGGVPMEYPTAALGTSAEAGGTVQVRLQYFDAEQRENLSKGFKGRPDLELVLLRGVGTIEWRFYDAKADEWATIWNPKKGRPHLIELMFGFSGETPERYVFWAPKLVRDEPRPPQTPDLDLENETLNSSTESRGNPTPQQ